VVNLTSQGDGWRATWKDSTGKVRQRRLGLKSEVSRAQALAMCREIERDHLLHPGKADAGDSPTLGAWWDTYRDMRRGDLADETLDLHTRTYRYLTERIPATRRLDSITRLEAGQWRAWLLDPDGRGLGEQSVCQHVRNAKRLFSCAVQHGVLFASPFDHLAGTAPDPDRGDDPDITPEQIGAIIDAAPTPQWRALIALCAYAGLRKSEALRFTRSDIQWDRLRIVVRPRTRRTTTKQRRREVRLEGELARVLLGVVEQIDDEKIADVGASSQYRRLDRIFEDAGVPRWDEPLQALRRWRDRTWKLTWPGYVVDAWLGHSAQVSAKYYLSVPEDCYGERGDVQTLVEQFRALTPGQQRAFLDTIRGETTHARTDTSLVR
jgi:integrase